MQPLRVNFTDQEATSKVREIPPSGDYIVNITDGKLKEVNPTRKNAGKPYWQLTFVIQEGPYAGTTLISSVMLFNTALYQLSQLLKALKFEVPTGDFVLPDLGDLIGKTLVVRGIKMPARTVDGNEIAPRFEIKGYKPYTGTNSVSDAPASLLP